MITKEIPRWICFDCANKYGTKSDTILTCHKGICGICKEEKTVSASRKWRPFKEITND